MQLPNHKLAERFYLVSDDYIVVQIVNMNANARLDIQICCPKLYVVPRCPYVDVIVLLALQLVSDVRFYLCMAYYLCIRVRGATLLV